MTLCKFSKIADKLLNLSEFHIKMCTSQFNLIPFCFSFYIFISILLSGCAIFGGGGGIERADNYLVNPPESWKKGKSDSQSDRTYRLNSGGIVTVTSSCSNRRKPGLEVLTRQLFIGLQKVEYKKSETQRIGKELGLHSFIEAEFDDVPFFIETFVIVKSKCVFDFTLMSRQPISSTDSNEFTSFLETFAYGNS